jgi:hypothetical protein
MHEAGDDTAAPNAEVTGGAAWMTYREIAAARGISHAAAIRLVQRHRWQKREGSNDGLAHVLVPHGAVHPTPPVRRPRHTGLASPASRPAAPPDTAAFDTALAAIETAHAGEVAALRERAEAAEAAREAERERADRAEAARDAEIALADQTVPLLKDAMDRAGQAEGRAHEAERARDRANAIADELRSRVEAAQRLAREAGRSVEAAQMAQAEAEADAAELRQAEAARKGRGVLARLRAALRGE